MLFHSMKTVKSFRKIYYSSFLLKDHIMSIPPIISPQLDNEIKRIFHNEGFHEIEIKLNYFFHNKAYLISAFTHSSKSKHCIISSYERYYTIKKNSISFLQFCLFQTRVFRRCSSRSLSHTSYIS
jgi:hypothetical protein